MYLDFSTETTALTASKRSALQRLKLNWGFVAVAFSLNHGAVMVVLAYATSDFGPSLGSWSSSALWATYGLAALLFASLFVRALGSKSALFWCLLAYSVYVGSAVAAKMLPEFAWVIFMAGSVVGGLAAGCLWTAQGNYVGASAAIFASFGNSSLEAANATFSSIFGIIYVGLEVCLKGLSSAIRIVFPQDGEITAMVTMTSVAFLSSFFLLFARDLEKKDHNNNTNNTAPTKEEEAVVDQKVFSGCHEIMIALKFFWNESRVRLLFPFSFSRTFTGAIETYYLNGVIVKNSLGADDIGILSAVPVLVAFALAVPITCIQRSCGSLPVMVLGVGCRMAVALSVLLFTTEQLIDVRWGIIVLYMLQGCSTIVGEITVRSVYLDFFPGEYSPAFANFIVAQSIGAAFALFVFPIVPVNVMGGMALTMDVIAVVCVTWAFKIHRTLRNSVYPASNEYNKPTL